MVGDDPDGKKKHDKGGDGVDNEHRGEAGEPHHHGVEAGVDSAAEHGNGEAEAASKGPGEKKTKRRGESEPGVARKDLAAYEVHHRVDPKGVTDEHDDGNHEGRETKGWADGDELTPPVGEGSQGGAAEGEEEGAGGEHVPPVGILQDDRGEAGGGDPDRTNDDGCKQGGEGETRVSENRGHEDDKGGDARVLAEEEQTAGYSKRTEERPGSEDGQPLQDVRWPLTCEHLF